MREIEFRGKAVKFNKNNSDKSSFQKYKHLSEKWIYGGFTKIGDDYYISMFTNIEIEHCIKIKPETLGQYTGLIDKNGIKIFEGDIVKGVYLKKNDEIVNVSGRIAYGLSEFKVFGKYLIDLSDIHNIEVIGNIYDNPELLGDKE